MTKQALSKNVWYDPDSNGYIGLDVTNSIPVQTTWTVEDTVLLPKNEYHCSLVAIRHYIDDVEQERSFVYAVHDFLYTHSLRCVSLSDKRYLCRKGDRMTIVAIVEIEGIDEFRTFIKTLIPKYEPPFPHVTLLKSNATKFGIALNSTEEFIQYCEKYENE